MFGVGRLDWDLVVNAVHPAVYPPGRNEVLQDEHVSMWLPFRRIELYVFTAFSAV